MHAALSLSKLVSVEYTNGRATCKHKQLNTNEYDKIPKTLLLSEKLTLQQKTFMLSVWNDIQYGYLEYSKSSLQKKVFSEFGQGLSWVTSRVSELVDINILVLEKGRIKVVLETILNMSDVVISNMLSESSSLENVVLEYEEKTGVGRGDVFDWKCGEEDVETKKKGVSPSKKIEPIISAIIDGCIRLEKQVFNFTKGDYTLITNQVNEIIENRDGDSEDRIIQKIVDSIVWKTDNCVRIVSDRKFYTKGFFTRKIKNNFASNLYHYDRDIESNPYRSKGVATKKPTVKVVEAGASKPTQFDYGIDF